MYTSELQGEFRLGLSIQESSPDNVLQSHNLEESLREEERSAR